MKFYDPKDKNELVWVETILKEGGIEYFLVTEPDSGIGPFQVHVAEEDVPHAEELLRKKELNKEMPL